MRYSVRKMAATVLLALSAWGVQAQNPNNYINLSNPNENSDSYAVTDFTVTPKTKIQTHVMFVQLGNAGGRQDLFGTSQKDGGLTGKFNFLVTSDYFQGNYGGNAVNIENPVTGKHYYVGMDKSGIFVDLTENLTAHDWTASFTAADISKATKMYIGANGDPTIQYRFAANSILNTNYYDFSVFEDNTMTHHYIPAIHSGKYQFYDTRHDCYIPTYNAKGYVASGDSCEHRYIELVNGKIHCKICDGEMDFKDWVESRKEDFGLTSMTPYLDVQADSAHAGQQMVYLSGQSSIDEVVVADSATNKVILTMQLPKAENSISLPLPATAQRRTLYALAHMTYGRMQGTGQDTSIVYGPVVIEQKPYHQLDAMAVVDSAVVDTTHMQLLARHYPCIRMAMTNPEEEDVLQGDRFVLQRAYKEDFSDAVSLTMFDYDDFSIEEKLADGTKRYWAYAIDKSDEGQYTTQHRDSLFYSLMPDGVEQSSNLTEMDKAILRGFYEYPDRRIYYRVVRSTVLSLWPKHLQKDCKSPYVTRETAKTANLLPIVTSVSVEQTENWLNDKRVNVTVRLDNPLPWEYNALLDSAKIVREVGWKNLYRRYSWPKEDVARIKLVRYSPKTEYNNGVDEAYKEYTIDHEKVTWDSIQHCFTATVTDCQSLPFLHYYYKAVVDTTGSRYPVDRMNKEIPSSKEDADKCWSSTAALIQSFKTTQGELKGKVLVEWEMGSGLTSELTLTRFDMVDKTTKSIRLNATASSYTDTDSIKPGHVYRYTLTATTRYRGETYTKASESLGWPSFYGTLKGRVQMHNGLGIAGAHVRISRTSPIDIPDVYEDDKLILKGVHEGLIAEMPPLADAPSMAPVFDTIFVRDIITDDKGYFLLDSALYTVDGAQYDIAVNHGYCRFKYNDRETTVAQVTLSASRCEYENLVFTSFNDVTLKGRVLYEKSTVPVRDASFSLNGHPVHDSNGNTVKTDQSGNFTLTLPDAIVDSLQVFKKGHTFKSGGFILSKNGDRTYRPEDLYGLTIWDQTKVRLVGRLAGGNRQGNQPLGFAMSRNNIGDDLTMILQLEGDNTAQIVYMDEHPDSTEINTSVIHPYRTLSQQEADVQDSTKVSYQRKRIIVNPSIATGEFFVDLFPTKYKVTQLSAKGYNTLYAANEGFDVLDLSEAVETFDSIYQQKDVEDKHYTYNAIYKRIYHEPVRVTATEFVRGRAVDYLGEGSLTDKNILGKDVKVSLYENGKYTFGHPVFAGGARYTMQVQAHEDYFYNGNELLDKVLIEGGELLMRNGLADNTQDERFMLDSLGTAIVFVDANNATFSLSGENALRKLNFSVKLNGYYYESEPIEGFVTGVRYKGTDLITDAGLTVVDVLRDPPGANSYSYLESGSKYYWENYHNIDITLMPVLHLDVGSQYTVLLGGWAGVGGGAFAGTESGGGISVTTSTQFPLLNYQNYRQGSYSLTLNDRIQTSSDPRDAGAMSDVYIGAVNTINFGRVETISVIDSTTYAYCQSAIAKGQVRIISQGKDESGAPYWLAIGEKVTASEGAARSFAYSQKYIIGTLIPEMLNIVSEKLIWGKTKDEVRELANSKKDVYYLSSVPPTDDNYASEGYYETIFPDGTSADDFKEDLVAKAMNSIYNWILAIGDNEKEKLEAKDKTSDQAVKQYSIAGTKISHSEACEYYYSHIKRTTSGLATKNDWDFSLGGSLGGGKPLHLGEDQEESPFYRGVSQSTATPGFKLSCTVDPGFNINTSGFPTAKHYRNVTTGYEIGTNDGSYMDVDVYRDELVTGDDAYEDIGWITEDSKDAKQVGNYIFIPRAGAARNPWTAPDSTIVYRKGQPLGNPFLKIENPKIYIDKPVVNNVLGDETATFVVRLANETELTQNNLSGYKPSELTLYVEDATNPNGAKLSMDGQALTSGRTFVMNPGQTLEKVIEVKRGAKGYDYENIQLVFCDQYMTLHDAATLSVHYVPTSTPLKLQSPTDKWVLNTLAEPDEDGYFLPVTISDFNTTYENFDHIELQYKKQTEGNSQWVTLCSWYCDSLLYNKGTGVKRLFDASENKLNYAFHGEKDPIEMNYDLRAVSFCRLGTGFVSRESEVISGTKDTRLPEVFGMPTPASGILTYEDVIQLNFTEPIAYNYLDETSNFKVQGYTNRTEISKSNTLKFPGEESQMVQTEVTRNLNHRSFTIDMQAQALGDERTMVLFSHGNQMENMAFGLTDDGCLFARLSGTTFKSVPLSKYSLDITKSLTHVGMLYDADSQDVQFFAGSGIIDKDASCTRTTAKYNGNGIINLGKDDNKSPMSPFSGKMLDVRLWGTALSPTQISTLGGKHLSGYEKQLIGYWPMTETQGNTIADMAHGAYMKMAGGVDWDNVDGFSLKIDRNRVELDAEYFSTTRDNDNSLTFWFKVDKMTSDAALLTVGNEMLPEKDNGRLRIGFKKENLVLTSNGADYILGSRNELADQNWHHFAMTIDRSQDQFASFIDSKLKVQESASLIDGMSSDYAAFGDTCLNAHFDVISQWDLALPSTVVSNSYNSRFTGHEMGLHAYLPFTVYDTGEQGALHADSCLMNAVYQMNDKGEYIMSSRRLITGGFNASKNLDKNEHAPIRELPTLENLDFSWSSTGTGLQININTNDRIINKEQLFVTVRGVEDLAGNVMKNPRMMTYYVDKNVLRWEEQEHNAVCREGEADTLVLSWMNVSGKQLSYTIDNAPNWLTISDEMGTVAPVEKKSLTLTVDAGLAAGRYTCVLYLTDEMGLTDPITLNITVKPNQPDWFVDKTQWDRNMNLRAVVETKSCNGNYAINNSKDDIIAAFIKHECVGVSHITADDFSAYLLMTIYGNKAIADDVEHNNIKFLLWNHESGTISELQHIKDGNEMPIHFRTNSVVGLPGDTIYSSSPVILRSSEKKEQSIEMERGWNWISLDLKTDASKGMNEIFVNQNEVFTDGDIIKRHDYVQYDEVERTWSGSLKSLNHHNVYQCYVAKSGSYRIMGTELPADSMYVVIQSGANGTGKWNDLPFMLERSLPVEEALADFQIGEKVCHGDVVKSLDEFIVADTINGKWVGTLKYMRPGKGYYIFHHAHGQTACSDTLRYYPVANYYLGSTAHKVPKKALAVSNKSSNMPVIARLDEGVALESDERLVARIDGQEVGEATCVEVGGESLLFISVRGNVGDKVTFAIERDEAVCASDARPITFSEEATLGTLNKPYLIRFGNDKADSEDDTLYDLQGRKLSGRLTDQRSGIYISNHKKIQK